MQFISGAMLGHAVSRNRRGRRNAATCGYAPPAMSLYFRLAEVEHSMAMSCDPKKAPGVVAPEHRQVLRVDLPKPLRGFEVEGRLAYLLPEQGKLQAGGTWQGDKELHMPSPGATRVSILLMIHVVQTVEICGFCRVFALWDGSIWML